MKKLSTTVILPGNKMSAPALREGCNPLDNPYCEPLRLTSLPHTLSSIPPSRVPLPSPYHLSPF